MFQTAPQDFEHVWFPAITHQHHRHPKAYTFVLAVVWLVIELRAFIVYNFRSAVAPNFAAIDEVWHNAARKQACPAHK